MAENEKQSTAVLQALVERAQEPKFAIPSAAGVISGHEPYIIVPNTHAVNGLERFLPSPLRVVNNAEVKDVDSFVRYWNRFKDERSVAAALIDEHKAQIVSHLDFHLNSTTPHWCKHTCMLGMKASEEWRIWTSKDGNRMSQVAFAEFLEENLDDITEPVGATLLEMITNMRVNRDVNFKSSVRLSSGAVQFNYSEEDRGVGNFTLPEEFKVGMAPFYRGEKYAVRARLRYRIEEGKLSMWYDLHRPEFVREHAFNEIVEDIGARIGQEILYGEL